MIELKKEYVIDSDIESVWNFLNDIKQVTGCIPNLENLQIDTPTKFRGKIKPPFSFIKGKFKIESEVKGSKEKESLTIIVKGSSIGASFEITMYISISSVSGTKIQIGVKIETTGLLKTLPKSLIQKVAEDIEAPMLRCIKEKLE